MEPDMPRLSANLSRKKPVPLSRHYVAVRLALLSLLVLGALFLAGSTGKADDAQNPPDSNSLNLNMSVDVGMGGRIRQGCYFPVTVTLENQGDTRRGTIRIVSEDSGRPLSATFLTECNVPANSRKTYVLYPYFLESDPSPSILVQYVEDKVLLTKQADLSFLQKTDKLWVEVADEGFDFTYLSVLSLPNAVKFSDIVDNVSSHTPNNPYGNMGNPYSTGGNQTALPTPLPSLQPAVVGMHPSQLPTHVEGYDAVDGIILNSRRFYELSAEQQNALAEWVLSGGKVIAWFGDDPARYKGSFLTGAVDGSGRQGPSACTEPPLRTTLSSLSSLPGLVGLNPVIGNFPVTYAPQKSAEVLLSEGSTPILQNIRVGNGNVLLSGLDLAALKSSTSGLDRYFAFLMGFLAARDERPSRIVDLRP